MDERADHVWGRPTAAGGHPGRGPVDLDPVARVLAELRGAADKDVVVRVEGAEDVVVVVELDLDAAGALRAVLRAGGLRRDRVGVCRRVERLEMGEVDVVEEVLATQRGDDRA